MLTRPLFYLARGVVLRSVTGNNKHLIQPVVGRLFDASLTLIQNHGVWFTIKIFNVLRTYINLPFKEALSRLNLMLPSNQFQRVASVFSLYNLPQHWDTVRLLPNFTWYYRLFFLTTIIGNFAPLFTFTAKTILYSLTGSIGVVYGGLLGGYSIVKDIALSTLSFYEWAFDIKIHSWIYWIRETLGPVINSPTDMPGTSGDWL